MRMLNKFESERVAGAVYGMCTIGDPINFSPVEHSSVDYTFRDPGLTFAEIINAGFWGCTGALATGRGIQGCVIGGGIAAGAKTMSFFINDAYDLYWKSKKK